MLTKRQNELLLFINWHNNKYGFGPSYQEMAQSLSLKSKSGIHRLVQALKERGFVSQRRLRARGVEVIKLPPRNDVSLRMLAAGVAAINEDYAHCGEYYDPAELAMNIYCAMNACKMAKYEVQ
jgi:SOS-response transcriptional repressor LexA